LDDLPSTTPLTTTLPAPLPILALALSVARLPQLTMRGLMGIAQETQDVARQRTQFRILRQLFEAVRAAGLALDTLSMGMSADLEDRKSTRLNSSHQISS